MYKSLQEYITLLDSKGELIRIKEFTDPQYEIAEITDRVSKQPGGGKALLFENTGTEFPVITNMMGSVTRIALALGLDSLDDTGEILENLLKEVLKERRTLTEKLRFLPQLKEVAGWMPVRHKGVAPCQERILYKPELSRLPVLRCWPLDGGRFVTLPLVHTIHPENGSRNLGMYRMQIISESSVFMHWHRHKTGAVHFSEFKGDRFPVAVALGGDPVYTYAATAPLPEGIDEYLLAGFLRNKPVSLTECLTQPLSVPADSDFVIEGYIEKKAPFGVEGPFGDHTGFYSPEDLYPVMHITCISHRKDAIYPATLTGVPPQEDKYFAMATEKIFLTPIQFALSPEIRDLHLPEEGTGHNLAVVSIKKRYPGQAVKVAHSLWGAGQMMFNKIMIVVDEEVDIRDRKQLCRAIEANYHPARDSHFSRGPLDVLDHAAPVCGLGGKMLIDATVKLPEEGGVQAVSEHPASFHFTCDEKDLRGLINIVLDKEFASGDQYLGFWLWGANCDPVRDSRFENGRLIMDARRKNAGKHTREWPSVVRSSDETIESVDRKWNTLGIGEFISSPSLRFQKG
ncbi:MAG: menaquinone biosynthesis decarboxylase [Bacteroidales bacterium]|nr:menaquinone biosynthesis decarboxylase [Bacteroidales bacterium]MDD2425609.1 menaquinone biosynthesis decarboxylase [Bacteroidales bacterium]MDD3989916.1 menaquinone biosynthesis decarboxylase [Bacteroidales bacterium]